ncbi:MAG: hypothetical protein KF824_10725 [Fimbriimonadaceae bacterium]|nr:MAG: hypothetical protein KF824_10725 [Fimbriimonadaceae bacterium]
MNQAEANAIVASSYWNETEIAEKLYGKDPSLWSSDPSVQADVAAFLGWVDAPLRTRQQLPEILGFVELVKKSGFTDAVVLGMGGSSLSSLMFSQAFPNMGGLKLHVLDSTNPVDVQRIRNSVPLNKTLFIVASKSGTTVEPLAFEEFFYSELLQEMGDNAAQHMVAITDPGSQMETRATERKYRKIFLGEPAVGGRFSVFTVFGMVPAALAGLPVESMLREVCSLFENKDTHGITAGIFLGELAKNGVDKITFANPPEFDGIALWAEQLIAESTGKHGVGTLPLATEPLATPDCYGTDRVFFVVGGKDFDPAIPTQEQAPRLTSKIDSPEYLAKVLYWLEIATATCGAVLGVNPFDQPNVQAAKDIARAELQKIQALSSIPEIKYEIASQDLRLYGSHGNTVGEAVANFIHKAPEGSQIAFLAFLPESEGATGAIQEIRTATTARLKLATSFGYGPRYLHSTGQYHKGGPNNGYYIVLTSEDAADFDIPGMDATFGQLKMAQALGDIGALQSNGRAVIHVHLATTDVVGALHQLAAEMHIAVAP